MNPSHKYFPVNDAQKAWGIYATCIGHSLTAPYAEFPSSIHPDEYFFTWDKGRILNEWQFILVEKGRGIAEFRQSRYSVNEGSLILIAPGCWHRYRPLKSTGWERTGTVPAKAHLSRVLRSLAHYSRRAEAIAIH